MDFQLSDIQRDIKQAAREFAEGEFPDVARQYDREEMMDRRIMQRARELGFVGVFIDEAYEGESLSGRRRAGRSGVADVEGAPPAANC